MKIYITGCARSGTTLLQFLMWAFENTAVIMGEKPLDVFSVPEVKQRSREEDLVAKRTSLMFGGEYPPELDPDDEGDRRDYRRALLDNIRVANLRILDIVRDPRDVLTSRHHSAPDTYYVSLDRWLRQYEDIDWLGNHWDKVTRIQYENLLRTPDQTQQRIASELDLAVEDPFSSYPDFVPDERDLSEDQVGAIKGIRELSTDPIGRWRRRDPDYILKLARDRPELNESLVELGYESDSEWYRTDPDTDS